MKGILLVLAPLLLLGLIFCLGVAFAHQFTGGRFWLGLFSGFWAGFGLMAAATFLNWAIGKLDKLVGGALGAPPPGNSP